VGEEPPAQVITTEETTIEIHFGRSGMRLAILGFGCGAQAR
jgi:hypothetical protein